jgi:hypothetical protein
MINHCKFVICYISLKGQYQEIGEGANGFTGQIDCIYVFNLIPFHIKNDKRTYTSLRKLLSQRETTFPLEKKTNVALPGPKTFAGERLNVNASSKEEFHHVIVPLPQLPVR